MLYRKIHKDFGTHHILLLEIASLWRLPVRVDGNPDDLFKEKFGLASFKKVVGDFVLLLQKILWKNKAILINFSTFMFS